ncbi:ORF6C domain-containing protein [Burkholderia cepacia]|uniref:ORF6C domain-containing protein n=1 Tax=Burkholderia cepacia TaxID=292 RepID=UPI003EE3BCAB
MNNIDRGEIAVRLVEERARIGYSQADFASKLDITREGLRLYETGQRGISGEFLAKAISLGIDVQYVLSGVRSPNVKEAEQAVAPPPPAVSIAGGATNVIGVVQNGGVVHQIHTQRVINRTVAEVKPGDDHISENQAAALTALVNEIVEAESKLKQSPKTHRAVWAALNAHCQVTRYRLIPASDFERAKKYLYQWLGRLNSMASAPVKDGDTWRKRKYSYIKINSKDEPEIIDRYISKNFSANSLTELSNDELEKVYRYVASRRQTRKKATT